jgi:NAD+ synthase (glutamine-hydrolysing)
LQGYIEKHFSAEEIAHHYQIPLDLVEDLIKKIYRAEYKRQQAAPGIRVSSKAFQVGRHIPIVQKWV